VIIYLAVSGGIAVYGWILTLTARLHQQHARLISRPRFQIRARGEHRRRAARPEIQVRVTAADWPPAPTAVAHG
jgi:hypothetical protein